MTNNAKNNRGSLVFIQRQVASTSSNLDFLNLTGYASYYIELQSIAPFNNNVMLNMFVSTNNGSSFLNTGYVAGMNTSGYNSNARSNINSTVRFPTTNAIGNSVSTDNGSGYIFCTNLVAGGGLFQMSGESVFSSGGTPSMAYFFGQQTSGVNALRFQMSSSNIVSGSITIYGLATP